MIDFNRPHLTGKEAHYIYQAVYSGKISGNGMFTNMCQQYFEERYGYKKCLLTTSCTDALEMTALLLDIKQGDEIIMPSYTFVSTAIAFIRQGAKIVFADSREEHPGINEDIIEDLITSKTKAIVPVHYAGVACDMDKIMGLAEKYNIFVVEDAAQAIDSYYKERPLGGIGHFGCFSFHETKNIQCGEGGMLAINDDRFIKRAEIIWEKGTNRVEFFRGEVNKYGWVDIGSSFLPSDILAAFLYAQLENLEDIQNKRKEIWNTYFEALKSLDEKSFFRIPVIPEYATNNGHMFYLVMQNEEHRNALIKYLKSKQIHPVFHYQSLHKSKYYKNKFSGNELPNANNFTETLVRMPMYYGLTSSLVALICKQIFDFYREY